MSRTEDSDAEEGRKEGGIDQRMTSRERRSSFVLPDVWSQAIFKGKQVGD